MTFCLPKFASDKMLEKLKTGEISIDKLNSFESSEERRNFFKEIVGEENAKQVNALIERKMLLKNQEQGIINAFKSLTGIKPEAKKGILERVKKNTEILQPKELDIFLDDLSEKILGIDVTDEEASHLVDLSNDIQEKESIRNADKTFNSIEDRRAYGYAIVDFNDYVDELKHVDTRRSFKEFMEDIGGDPYQIFKEVTGFSKSIIAAYDDSALLNQGIPTFFAHPTVWKTNALKSFTDIYNTIGGKKVMREIKAMIVSDPNYDLFKKMKLGLGGVEEAFPSSLPEKIPLGIGKLYQATENAYNGFQLRNRVDLANLMIKTAKEAGHDITDKQWLLDMGTMVNSLTGRGHLGPLEGSADFVNNTLFSGRFIKSKIDILTAHRITGRVKDPMARREARNNLIKLIGGITTILLGIKALSPDSVELDPRSSHSGKVKLPIPGDHWIDITGGFGSILTLATRIALGSTKSTVDNEVRELNTGKFGSKTYADILIDFAKGKVAPLLGVIRDYAYGKDMNGNKPTIFGEIKNSTIPFPIQTLADLKDSSAAGILAGMLTSSIGLNMTSYDLNSTSYVTQNEPIAIKNAIEKINEGDKQGARSIVKEFNEKLKEQIKSDLLKKDNADTSKTIEEQIETRFNKDKLEMPTTKDASDYNKGEKNAVVEKVLANGKPVIKKDTELQIWGIVGTVIKWADAIHTDPQTAFHDIFNGEKIIKTSNGAVMVERLPLSESEPMAEGDANTLGVKRSTMRLDHTVPLEIGGDNTRENLKLITIAEWKHNTPVENYLGTALKEKRIDGKTAQDLIKQFKNKTITFAQIKQQVK